MTKIAHLTDLHLLEDEWDARRGRSSLRLGFCSLLRPRDPAGRRARLARALAHAVEACPDHLVVTGDLTEDGADAQFEVLADVLRDSGIPARDVTLVPGNHDAYTDGDAFRRALAGPLAAYAPTSTPGAVTRLPGTHLLAVSTAVPQHFTRSMGAIDRGQLAVMGALAARTSDVLVVAQHHPPLRQRLPPMQWLDGLREHRALRELLERPHAHVLHGHTHRAVDRSMAPGGPAQIFSAEAVVESPQPLRLYEVADGRVWPIESARPEPMAAAVLATAGG